jgi:hypothetical protein
MTKVGVDQENRLLATGRSLRQSSLPLAASRHTTCETL